MYFKGHPLNDLDKILTRVPERLRGDVIVDFQPDAQDLTALTGTLIFLSRKSSWEQQESEVLQIAPPARAITL